MNINTKYKSEKEEKNIELNVVVDGRTAKLENTLKSLKIIAKAVNRNLDMVNTTGWFYPVMAKKLKIAQNLKLDIRVEVKISKIMVWMQCLVLDRIYSWITTYSFKYKNQKMLLKK